MRWPRVAFPCIGVHFSSTYPLRIPNPTRKHGLPACLRLHVKLTASAVGGRDLYPAEALRPWQRKTARPDGLGNALQWVWTPLAIRCRDRYGWPTTLTGTLLSVSEPSPSAPRKLLPQQYAVPAVVSPQA